MWLVEIIASYDQDSEAQEIIAGCTLRPLDVSLYTYQDWLIKYKGKIYIGRSNELRMQFIQFMHSSSMGGHSGIQGTFLKVQQVFSWPGMREQVKQVVSLCQTCQLSKHETVRTPGLLQPLPIPDQAWVSISMDFIDQLPNSQGKTMIWVVVDRFTKYGHFIALSHPISASSLAQVFFDSIYKLHGLPSYIVSDRDTILTSNFWKELMSTLGIQQQMSSAYHPQTDGQTERVNQCLEGYLRCMCGHFPKKWSQWIALAEWWYNTTYHTAIQR